ncbi:MAG: hypothetical protein VCA12_04855 [Pseudomonadales bacterium]|jgi:hypothetical protein|nr:hypothetical protein [Pseudomonadales bacterium]|tara:strand:+ start:593 stop:958 length:366 start_codon:yes stop_codon:yes gene_type:complete
MGVRLEKPWLTLDPELVASLPGQLGVFQLANENHEVVYIGFAGGRSLFGLKGELANWLGRWPFFRVEVNMAYRTRCRELLMVHFSDHGSYPTENTAQETAGLGRLSITAVTKMPIKTKEGS